MYKPVNPKPKFVPLDIVRIKKTGELVIIQEPNLNVSQESDDAQWSFSIIHIDKKSKSHVAWYDMDELELVNNIFEIIANEMKDTHSSSRYDFSFKQVRRS